MSRIAITSAAGLMLVGALAGSGPASAQDKGVSPLPPPGPYQRSITAEWIALWRDEPDGTPFTGPDIVGQPFVPFSPSDLDPDMGNGLRVSLEGVLFGKPTRFTAFAVFPMEDEKTIFDPTQSGTNATYDDDAHLNPGADFTTTNSDDLFALTVEHRTFLAGTEWSFFRDLPSYMPGSKKGWRLLYGTRSLYLGENLKSTAFDDSDDFQGTNNDIDRVSIRTRNFLYGPQLGVEGVFDLSPRKQLTLGVKGALQANFVERERSFSSDDNLANRFSDSIDDVGFAQTVEGNARLDLRVSQNTFLTLSGMVMWVNGVSEAAEHYATVTDLDDRSIRDDGDVLFYGGSVGLKFVFPVEPLK